ncbi:DUF559 domain-containing protein [Microbispora sp. ATCC PTA-5024]|uniref:DUF559 domain-containing protein n=1 Tax=Microbispora sp. ATCC PTA-5024 TaxID=316330 RepID=UPI0007C7843F|nr:DUF559 domain-containing protein [Microbispora sp. ATCC PTA-5024]
MEPLPEGAPATVVYDPRPVPTAADTVNAVLTDLEKAAAELFPAWLPEAATIEGAGGASVAAVRALALRAASASRHFGPFLADLAELSLRAMTGPDVAERSGAGARRFAPEVRAAGLARVIAAGFRRDSAALLVLVPPGLSPAGEEVLVAASEWLAHHGGFGVWLAGAPLLAVDRVETIAMRLSPRAAAPPVDLSDPRPTLRFPAVAGIPHPASRAEKALEAALRSCSWAAGRAWNQAHQSSPLTPAVRVDLMWRAERCVVEVDGPEHRKRLVFEADRQRDVRLQLDGFAVLRFTNDQIMTEMDTVLHQLERFLHRRRAGTFEGSTPHA